ncbi:VanZ family protein [Nocardioides sp. CPCC 205120]|uniref:VanZ family protein n=1 Tax=Nocardioides sp. CPCC 205120 TaxID=3406462 RepID=UPI003B510050
MHEWTWPAYVAVLLGGFAFALLLVPILAFQYRRYGQFTPRRVLGASAVSVYGTAVVAYTLLPLPATRGDWCDTSPAGTEWRPFHFVSDIADATAGTGPLAVLGNRATLQVLFNVVLFVPWGVMLRGYWGRSVAVATGTGLLASLAIETTQVTGVWGLYDCAYRVGDVDDLIANTLGALVGALVAPLVLWWMPRPHSFDDTRRLPRPVTTARRWLGMALDLAAYHALGAALLVTYRLAVLATTGELPAGQTWVEEGLSTLVPAVVVFLLPALGGSGASLGQRAARLVPVWERPSPARRLARAAAVGGTYALVLFLARWQDGTTTGSVAGTAANLLLVAALVAVPLTHQRGLSGVLTGARFADDRARPPA